MDDRSVLFLPMLAEMHSCIFFAVQISTYSAKTNYDSYRGESIFAALISTILFINELCFINSDNIRFYLRINWMEQLEKRAFLTFFQISSATICAESNLQIPLPGRSNFVIPSLTTVLLFPRGLYFCPKTIFTPLPFQKWFFFLPLRGLIIFRLLLCSFCLNSSLLCPFTSLFLYPFCLFFPLSLFFFNIFHLFSFSLFIFFPPI